MLSRDIVVFLVLISVIPMALVSASLFGGRNASAKDDNSEFYGESVRIIRDKKNRMPVYYHIR